MTLVTRRRTGLTEKCVFAWSDAWLGQYVVTDLGNANVSFERFDPHAGRSDGRVYTLPRGEMERLLAAGNVQLLEREENAVPAEIELGTSL